jgi:hypothetical protein
MLSTNLGVSTYISQMLAIIKIPKKTKIILNQKPNFLNCLKIIKKIITTSLK